MNFKNNVKRFFTLSRNAEGFTLVVEVLAEAIQAEGTNGTKTAVEDAWGVTLPIGG